MLDLRGRISVLSRTGIAKFAVIPVRNSTVGEIASTRSLMTKNRPERGRSCRDKGRTRARSRTRDGVRYMSISVRSHAEALLQCSNFFAANPQLEKVTGFDTASSVQIRSSSPACRNTRLFAASVRPRYTGRQYCGEISQISDQMRRPSR